MWFKNRILAFEIWCKWKILEANKSRFSSVRWCSISRHSDPKTEVRFRSPQLLETLPVCDMVECSRFARSPHDWEVQSLIPAVTNYLFKITCPLNHFVVSSLRKIFYQRKICLGWAICQHLQAKVSILFVILATSFYSFSLLSLSFECFITLAFSL